MLKIALYINSAIEILVGLAMFAKPDLIPNATGGVQELLFVKMYGAAALAIGVMSLLMATKLNAKELITIGLVTLSIFHVGVAIANWTNNPEMPVAILHTVLGALFLFLYTKER